MSYFKYESDLPKEDNDHIYFDLSMINDDRTGTSPNPYLYINEVRNNPILNNAGDYYLSVVRFNLVTGSLPVFLPQVNLDSSNPNELIYQVCLSYNGIDSPVNLVWIPQDYGATPPNIPLQQTDINSPYYNCYSFQHFIYILNNALSTAMTNLISSVGGGLPSTNPPFVEWDIPNYKAIINADILGFSDTLTTPIYIYFNSPLYSLFASFDALYYGQAVTNGKNYKLTIANQNGGNIYNLNSINYLQAYQEISTFPTVANPVQSLVFASSLLPVVSTQVAVPKVYNNNSPFFTGVSNSNFTNMITDFEVGVDAGNGYRPSVSYNPTAQYRYIDMVSNTQIQNIDISVFWKDNYSNLHPFILQSQNSCNIKILFRKKSSVFSKY